MTYHSEELGIEKSEVLFSCLWIARNLSILIDVIAPSYILYM